MIVALRQETLFIAHDNTLNPICQSRCQGSGIPSRVTPQYDSSAVQRPHQAASRVVVNTIKSVLNLLISRLKMNIFFVSSTPSGCRVASTSKSEIPSHKKGSPCFLHNLEMIQTALLQQQNAAKLPCHSLPSVERNCYKKGFTSPTPSRTTTGVSS